jgi:membrane-bound serine protease (ClpP class)
MKSLRAALGLAVLLLAAAPVQAAHVNVVTVDGAINPAVSDYLVRAIERSGDEGAEALLLELDTPGGLVASTKDIIQAMLNARVPVIVYVSPHGAWAGSAGVFITLAGHVAAMAPGTSIGAAHPVSIGAPGGGGKKEEGARDYAAEKAENFMAAFIESIAKQRDRNVEWAEKAVRESVAIPQDEALELNVIDLVATSRAELFEAIEGREVKLASGEVRTLRLREAPVVEIPMSALNSFLDILSTPDIAMLLIFAGMLGLYVEFTQPGVIVPGVAGAVCLVLGFVSLQIIPFSWFGLLLMASGLGMLALEIFITSYGLLFAGGVACLLLGGSMLFDLPESSDLNVSFWSVLVPAVSSLALFAGIVIVLVGRSLGRPQVAGVHELVGMVGRARSALDPEGVVFVRGEFWNARALEPITDGERVEVTAVQGLELRVRRAPDPV